MSLTKEKVGVLIAEDDFLVSEMVKGLLQEMGYDVIGEAIDGHEAVKLVCDLKPDVVLMDIQMPEQNGIEATREIFNKCPTPVVVLTAYETADLVNQASEAGVGAYLIKPPNAQELERAITIAIARFDDTIKLRRLNRTLKNRNEELDTFAHSVSHNLQYSLDLIIGYANMLKGQARLPEELEHYLTMVIKTGHTMTDVIDELQLLSGIRTTDVKSVPLNMNRIVARVQQRLVHFIDEYEARLVVPSDWPIACGHAPWIEEVWVNYITNGVKYGGSPPRLQLGATGRSDGSVRFWVRDNGPGLSSEDLPRLFEPFTRLANHKGKGLGLGLSTVKRIVEKLGGKVGVESGGGISGEGCTFYFTLPDDASRTTSADAGPGSY